MAYLSALAGITFVHEAMAVPAVRTFLEDLLYREAMPTLAAIPGHPREQYVASVLERFANRRRARSDRAAVHRRQREVPDVPDPDDRPPARGRRPDRARGDGAGGLGALPRAWSTRRSQAYDAERRRGAPPRRRRHRRPAWRSSTTARSSRRRCGRRRASAPRSPSAYRRIAEDGPIAAMEPGARPAAHRSRTMTASRAGSMRLQHDRQHAIYMLALRQGSVDVADLARRYGVTTETIRRDLSDMQGRQLLRRVHGGAVPVERMNHEPMVEARDDGERGGEAADRARWRSRRCPSAARSSSTPARPASAWPRSSRSIATSTSSPTRSSPRSR